MTATWRPALPGVACDECRLEWYEPAPKRAQKIIHQHNTTKHKEK